MILFILTLLVTGCGASHTNFTSAADARSQENAVPVDPSNPSEPAASDIRATRVDLTVSAAASLTDALTEIEQAYELQHPSIELSFNYGGSGALQRQIEQGAPVDLFISASADNMLALADKHLIDAAQTANLLNNELVVVIPADSKLTIASEADLAQAGVGTIAIGIPESVPAGQYAKESLTNAKLWDALQAKTVQGKDVRQVLQYVETGNADAGFVYRTDALSSRKVAVAFEVDPATYPLIEYPVGIVKATKHPKEAEDLYHYLQSQEALDVFDQYGFSVPK
ncbi:molybdate ABC transporter substrate-binding protein [Cohnella lubricantis]|uniref:Molybdate ABC transporter substrate-binding protein n=1 Tax=Cohnella lubricantis TaxID=2163172 RepID=A0A841TEX5_9BACL|nr:molybdate ABC transporter substrate-binding protein [Cohnella lubricantis]